MNKCFLLILILLCSVFFCKAQSNIETSPFVNVPISVILHPIAKTNSKKKSKPKDEASADPLSDEAPIDFNLKIDYFRLPDGNTAAFFTSEIENKELAFESINQIKIARVEIFAKITSIDKQTEGLFNDRIIFSASKDKQSYVKGVILPSGNYRIIFIIRDSTTGKTGVQLPKFTVPKL